MRHRVKGKKLNRTKSHREATLRALVTALFENKRIHTTETKARALRPYAEKLLTRARKAYLKEQQGLISDGNKHDLNTRRDLANHITKKSVIEDLFDEIIPEISDRPGGYTRIVKTGFRRGDSGKLALIELVDYNRDQTEAVSIKPKKKKKKQAKKEQTQVQNTVEEEVSENIESSDEVEEILDTTQDSKDQSAGELDQEGKSGTETHDTSEASEFQAEEDVAEVKPEKTSQDSEETTEQAKSENVERSESDDSEKNDSSEEKKEDEDKDDKKD